MAKATSIYTIVARGISQAGHEWSLLWPSWKWLQLTKLEQAAVIAEQTALMQNPQPEQQSEEALSWQ